MIPLTNSRHATTTTTTTTPPAAVACVRRRAAAAILLAAAGALLPAAHADAQILRVPKNTREPAFWAGAGVGYYQQNGVLDGRTNTYWNFGSGVQYRGSLEYSLGRGSSLGVTGTYAHLPLRYESLDGSPLPSGAVAEDAHADVSQLLGTFHLGGGEGFHYVLDAGLGVTHYARFRSDASGATLAPLADTDVAFAIGTGFGYSPNAATEFFVVQDYGNSIHQRDGLSNDARTNVQQLTTRIGARFGTGARRSR